MVRTLRGDPSTFDTYDMNLPRTIVAPGLALT